MENGYSLTDIASVTGENGLGGNAWVLIILFALIFGMNGGLFGGNQGATTSDVQRSIDLSAIQSGQAAINADIQRGIYEINNATKDAVYNNLGEIRDVGSAVASNGSNIINNLTAMQSAIQNCCCELKSAIMENRFLESQNTSQINANTTAQTQRIIDTISQNKIESLQNQINQLQIDKATCGIPKINPYLYSIVGGTAPTTTT